MMATPIQPFSEIEPSKLEAITPSQFITFTMQNTLKNRLHLCSPLLRIAVLDSPLHSADKSPVISAMIVPKDRETDWNFCTKSGHMQLLFKFHGLISRLILIGNIPPVRGPFAYKRPSVTDRTNQEILENELKPLLLSLHPKSSSLCDNGLPGTLFLKDDDDVAYRVTVDEIRGPIVGEILVEDIQLLGYDDRNKQLRRRLRFQRMPQVLQSQAILVAITGNNEATTPTDLESLRKIESVRFEANTQILVHPYLIPMVWGLAKVASHLDMLLKPRALCLGVGGGVLLNFLDTEMGFEVTGVESDRVVLDVATEYFGLNKTGSIRLVVGDAIFMIENVLPNYPPARFDVVFVDLDSSEAENGFCAPPPEFIKKPVFEGLRSAIDDGGVVIMNEAHLNQVLYATMVKELKEIFHKVFLVYVEDIENRVVIATVSPPSPVGIGNVFLMKLKSKFRNTYISSIDEL
ncbi:hypothetical protein LXL04_012861 [Taraxacum kok-saghyz]